MLDTYDYQHITFHFYKELFKRKLSRVIDMNVYQPWEIFVQFDIIDAKNGIPVKNMEFPLTGCLYIS